MARRGQGLRTLHTNNTTLQLWMSARSVLRRRPDTVAAALILFATFGRVLCALTIVNPLSGSDARTYLNAAQVLAVDGLLADAPRIPYWPAGYPTLIAQIYRLFGLQADWAVQVLQVVLLGVASWCAYRLISGVFDKATALLFTLLLAMHPALLASSNAIMYESSLASFLTIAVYLLWVAAERPGGGMRHVVGSGLLLAIAAALQPKVILAALLVAGWLWWQQRLAIRVAVLMIVACLGPLALAARTEITDNHWAVSANLGVTMGIGFNDAATGGYVSTTPQPPCGDHADMFARDRALVGCSIRWAMGHPLRTAELTARKAMFYWSPMAGPLSARGTWYHSFRYQRVLPASLEQAGFFRTFDEATGNLWTVLTVMLVGTGAWLGVRDRRTRPGTTLLSLPVLAFFLVSLGTIGDARFRLPTSLLITGLIAFALTRLWSLFRGTSLRHPPAGRFSGPFGRSGRDDRSAGDHNVLVGISSLDAPSAPDERRLADSQSHRSTAMRET